jgi:hypothetical protein
MRGYTQIRRDVRLMATSGAGSFEEPVASLLIAPEDPAPAGPPVAPPAVAAEASREPEPCALSRVPLGPCYLNNTSMTQSANGSFRIPVLLRCARAPGLAADKAATGESRISGAVCLRRMVW